MTDHPLVSAVIPVHNGALFLEAAINSVLSQDYPRIECIVVDDGSTDETPDIIRRFGSDLKAIQTPHQGVSSARNKGAEAASGHLLAFLDADDVWLPTKLSRQVPLFAATPDLGLVYCGITIIDMAGSIIEERPPPPPEAALRNTLLIEGTPMSIAQTGVVPTDLFRRVGGFDQTLSTSADADLACRIALDHPLAAVVDQLVLYRLHPGQMHLDPHVTESDRNAIIEKFFGGGLLAADLTKERTRARANLYLSLANRYWRMGDRWNFLRCLAVAALASPTRLLPAARRFLSAKSGVSRHSKHRDESS